MKWQIEYIEAAYKDLKRLDNSQRLLVLKAVEKVSKNPLPITVLVRNSL
jgi:mRNA interferase RelE/StbE